MKIIDFFKSLLPNFSKMAVLDDIRVTRVILTAVTIPAYQDAVKVFGGRKFGNESLQRDWETFKRTVRGLSAPNTILAIDKAFKPMLTTLDLIEQLVEKDYADDIEGAGITYYKAAVLQMLESIGFATDFANKYLNYVYVLEAAELADDEDNAALVDEINAAIVPAEVRFLHERFMDFCTVMDTLAKPTDKIKTDFEAIPDVVITAAGDKVVQNTVGASKLDPFRHGIVPLAMNPVYHIRMRMADYQHYRYERAKEEKSMLELRKLKLERSQHGKKDAAVDKQIEYTQRRIDGLAEKIREVEGQYA